MNVLEVCLSPDLGGLELFMVACFNDFSKKTNCTIVIEKGTKLDTYLEGKERLHVKRNKLLPIVPAMQLAKIIDERDIDILHFHWTKDIATVVLAKILSRKKPKIIQTRNMTMTRFKEDFYHKWLYKKIEKMHAVTKQVATQLQRFIPQEVRPEIETIYMGTSVNPDINSDRVIALKEQYNLQNAEDFVVGIVGRIEEGKGQWLLIEALSMLPQNVKALIVGHTMDKTYLQELQSKVESLGLEKRVIFTGFTKEVAEHFALMDIHLLATPQETFGLVVIEAMANRVAVIATNKGGPLEIIDDGVDGVLFERTVEDLSKKVMLFYEDRTFLEQVTQKAYEKVCQKFDAKKQLGKLYDFMADG